MRMNPELPEWMMGFPRGWITDVVADNDAKRCAGNAVCPQQALLALSLLVGRAAPGG